MSGKRNFNHSLRYFAVLISTLIAGIYFLIGFNVISVLNIPTDQTFGLAAGLAYVLGVVLLLAFDHRLVWILGAILQVFVIYTYIKFASQRTPAFEIWGILLRAAQLLILLALTYLAVRVPGSTVANSPKGIQQERQESPS